MLQLQVDQLTKTYGSNLALNGFSYTFTEGVYGLLGPNGAGKSTLMNLLTDNLLPSSGVVRYNGQPINKLGKKFLKVLGYMPQQQGIYDTFTAERFLYYIAALKGLKKKEADVQIPHLLSLVNLQAERYKKLGNFSGGMKQRILIAQALIGDPEVLILDEPTAGLDPKERIRIRNLISEISFNKIVLVATHVVTDIEYIAKEVLLLKKGKLIDSGSPYRLSNALQGVVFELQTTSDQLPEVAQHYKIGNIAKDVGHITIRIVSDEKPELYTYNEVKPTLEDLYLYRFDTEDLE
ncbi:ABC transporter ATP-binding protein [Paenibacillus radicis (ex Gao et al. 2016)]|uniref:ABC transporter ATP-binding protein n=1 Tax=Paenibacillus radicis (ex Gao et al. 2016) TaxID=1737354 RepID=A0A917LZP8_9BACL|nr:ABC transporter ATP-binding protein [Paenibacillus radicis (ex Gao et al. 2016)]GGG67909.1 ABC transporter ATP-binding protein [Paenibacillus radicis (ex Gao et al. 2016)]